MNISDLQYMIALEETGNITKTAERLYVSPSAVSQCLKKENEEQGLPLFVYKDRRMVPTEAGKLYLDTARKIVRIHDETYRKMGAATGPRDAVRIACSPVFMDFFQEKILPAVAAAFPKNHFTVTSLNAVNALEYLSDSMAEIALLPVPSGRHSTMLTETILGENRLLLAVPKAYLHLQEGASPQVEDCETIPFILLSRNSLMRARQDQVLQKHGITSSRIIEAENYIACRQLLESGAGAAFLPEGYLSEEAKKHFYLIEPTPNLRFQNLLLTSSVRTPDPAVLGCTRLIPKLWKQETTEPGI